MLSAAAAKSLQSCPTLCDPINGSPPGSAISGFLQARTLEWVAISFCNAWKWKVKVKLLSRVWLFMTPWTAAHQAPPSMGFSRQEYWSGVSSPSLQDMLTSQNNTWVRDRAAYGTRNGQWKISAATLLPGRSQTSREEEMVKRAEAGTITERRLG